MVREWRCVNCDIVFPPSAGYMCAGHLCSDWRRRHFYCDLCMVAYFEATLRDEALFPPRCCGQPILDEEDSFWLPSPPLMARIKEKEEERRMVDKTYCSNPRCSAFLPKMNLQQRRHGGKSVKCQRCQTLTCRVCKKPGHTAACDFSPDPDEERLHRLAKDERWKRCFSCKQYLELDVSCFEVLCRCGAEICYRCAQQPGTCGCSRDTLPPPPEDPDGVDERDWCRHDVWQRVENNPYESPPWQCFHCKGAVRWGPHIWGRWCDHFWRCSGFHCRIELCDFCWEAEQANRAIEIIQDFLASRRATALNFEASREAAFIQTQGPPPPVVQAHQPVQPLQPAQNSNSGDEGDETVWGETGRTM